MYKRPSTSCKSWRGPNTLGPCDPRSLKMEGTRPAGPSGWLCPRASRGKSDRFACYFCYLSTPKLRCARRPAAGRRIAAAYCAVQWCRVSGKFCRACAINRRLALPEVNSSVGAVGHVTVAGGDDATLQRAASFRTSVLPWRRRRLNWRALSDDRPDAGPDLTADRAGTDQRPPTPPVSVGGPLAKG